MALLWVEGFESIGTTIGNAPAPANVLANKYKTVISESSFDVDTGRNGSGRSILFGASNSRFHTPDFSTTDRTLIVGFAFQYKSPGLTAFLCNLFSAGSWMLTLWFDGYGKMRFLSNLSAEIGAVDNVSFMLGRWYWVEFKVYTDNTAGTIDMRVGGKNVFSFTGDTQFGANNYVNGVNFKDNTGMACAIDDFYVCDGSGTDNNDFLGNSRVKALRPGGDYTTGWATSSPSANHWENVDDEEHDNNTSYIQDATANAAELYAYTDLADLDTIFGLMVNTVCRTNTGVNETLQITVDSSGSTATVNTTFSPTSFMTRVFVTEQDPNASSAWTDTTVDAAKFGYTYI